MILGPKVNQTARVHYRKSFAKFMPMHGKTGRIVIVSRGKGPRNVGVLIGDAIVCIPKGNLNLVEECD